MGLNPRQLAALAEEAGWPVDTRDDIVAIALAESGGRPDARGDVALMDAVWGPSIGLTQIRSLKNQYGTPQDDARDELANLDPLTNMRHALQIAGGGTNLQPWSTWWGDARARSGPGRGSFVQFLDEARAAVGDPTPVDLALLTSNGGAKAELAGHSIGDFVFPWRWGSTIKDASGDLVDVVGAMVANLTFIGAGLSLVVLGVYKTANPGSSTGDMAKTVALMAATKGKAAA
jgi:hypothetical protein